MIPDSNQTAFAQTQWKGRYVETALLDQVNPQIATPSKTDYTVIVWEDRRNGTSDIYAQMIENNTGVAMWDPIDGVAVCTAVGAQINPRAAYDSLGGVIITWEDYRDRWTSQISDTTVMDIYAHRIILSNGQLDANWSSNPDGVPVCVRTNQRAHGPRIVGTTDGAYITWTDFRNSSGWPDYDNRDVYVQYLLSATGSYPGGYNWVSNGIAVTANDDDQQNPDIALNYSRYTARDRYGVVIAFEDNRDGAWQVYTASRGADGSDLWQVGEQPIDPNNAYDQSHPRVAAMGTTGKPDPGVAVTWVDARGWQGTTQDNIHAQSVYWLDGDLRWNGGTSTPLCTADRSQRRPRIAASEDWLFVVWEDPRDSTNTQTDVYYNVVQDANPANPVYQSDQAGVLCDESGQQLAPEVDLLDNFVVAWEDWRAGDPDIYGNLIYALYPTQFHTSEVYRTQSATRGGGHLLPGALLD